MILIEITQKGPTPGLMTKKEFNKLVLEPSWIDVGTLYHKEMVPLRFTKAGARALRFKARQGDSKLPSRTDAPSYTDRKEELFGHDTPMVWTGDSRDDALFASIKSTFKGVTISIKAPNLLKKTSDGRIRKADEFRRVSAPEKRRLAKTMEKSIQRRIDGFKKKKTEKVK